MICSLLSQLDADGVAVALQALLEAPVQRIHRWPGGGNNRLYQVTAADRRLALKSYGPVGDPGSDRLLRETAALSFLERHGVTVVPTVVAVDRTARLALYGWIDGTPVSREPLGRQGGDLPDMIRFILALRDLGRQPDASGLAQAAEACLDAKTLVDQIRARVSTLMAVPDEPALSGFLSDGLRPALAAAEHRLQTLYRIGGLAVDDLLPQERCILSPSDFGFHNALRRTDGRLAFLDFEYFGWDDPVKLLADTLWHPAYRLSTDEQWLWVDGLANALGPSDPALSLRLNALFPLYGLRWCAILLNEFLPVRWHRRLHATAQAGTRPGVSATPEADATASAADWTAAKAVQLAKALGWLAEVRRLLGRPFEEGMAGVLPLRLPPLSSGV
jgi:hypothetical protein